MQWGWAQHTPQPLWVQGPAVFTAMQHFELQIRDLNEYKIFMQKMSDLDLSCSFSSMVGLIFQHALLAPFRAAGGFGLRTPPVIASFEQCPRKRHNLTSYSYKSAGVPTPVNPCPVGLVVVVLHL